MSDSNKQSQGQTKKCPKCQEDIQLGAKKCKHCGADLRNWFVKHKIITGILVLFVIGIIGSAIGGGESTKQSNSNSTATTNKNSSQKEESTTKVTKAKCDQVKSGMTRDQVIDLLGEPSSTSESEISGIGKTEYLHFQEGFSTKACSVTLSNGKVSSKTWTDL